MELKRLKQLAGVQLNEGSSFEKSKANKHTVNLTVPAFLVLTSEDTGDRAFREYLADELKYSDLRYLSEMTGAEAVTEEILDGYDVESIVVLVHEKSKATDKDIIEFIVKNGDSSLTHLE